MSKFISALCLAWAIATPAHSQTVSISEQKTTLDSSFFSRSDGPFAAPSSPGVFGWISRFEEIKPSTQAQLDRLGKEADAGRAEAVAFKSRFLEKLPDGSEDCASILGLLRKAKELGNPRADYLIGMFYARKTCGESHPEAAIPAFLEAVVRDNPAAASELSRLYDDGPRASRDAVLAYVYAQFAAQRTANRLPMKSQAQPAALRAKLSRSKLEQAEKLLAELTAKADAHRTRLSKSMSMRILGSGESTTQPPGWSFFVWEADSTGECFENLVGNCRGVPRTLIARITNTSSERLMCWVHIKAPAFAGEDAFDVTRAINVAPGAKRRVTVGVAQSQISKKAGMSADCVAMQLTQENVCEAKLQGEFRADNIYPPDALEDKAEGVVVVRAFVAEPGKMPVDVELVSTSGSPLLDETAVKAIMGRTFDVPCDRKNGIATLGVKFSLN